MKLDHETILRNYQKALAYAKEHYSNVSMDTGTSTFYYSWNYQLMLDGVYAMEYNKEDNRISNKLHWTIKNGNIQLARGKDVYKPILIPNDIDMLTFLAFYWDDLKARCEETLDAYNRAMNFDPEQPVSKK